MQAVTRSKGREAMANLLIRDVPDDVVERLKQKAEANARSLQKELLSIIEEAAMPTIDQWLAETEERFQARKAWGVTDDSTDLIREDRDTR